ncbi:TetR/AcrR family transcriptional regulator [Pseudoramibacter porci]|uniref:TetR/AcrR family transcriptional regulator n=1 Tax=Pseudoramibacter porci TaxID=2606631 RepID=A0A7X2NFI4_9FIRM|nr:TetR/AcrR family transcriptional regulator [Pseudoramibacter porci]MSS19652.1 TetR/AcrR family transcriptional regulator [Pseudoramibacter porci]
MGRKAEEKRDLILEQARKIFLNQDFDQVTMTAIINACGISHGGIYRYFASPSEIFVTLFERDTHTLLDAVSISMWEQRSAVDILKEVFKVYQNAIWDPEPNMAARYNTFFKNHPEKQDVKRNQIDRFIKTIAQVLVYGNERGELNSVDSTFWANQLVYYLEGLDHNVSVIGLKQKEVENLFILWLEHLKND